MTTTTVYPAASSDDATWSEGLSAFDGTDTELFAGDVLAGGYGNLNCFVRFALSITTGATINEALFKMTASATYTSSGCNLIFSAIDAASPAAPTTYSGAENATRTTANVTWSPPNFTANNQYDSPDLKTILQELVDSYSITYVVIYMEDNNSTNNRTRDIYSYDNSSDLPELYVDYTPAGGLSIPVAMANYRNLRK